MTTEKPQRHGRMLSFQVPPELEERINDAAKRRYQSRSEVIRQSILAQLDKEQPQHAA
jgi:Arc/MetJ-type ribon-helix-helix transcriptional regulator